MLKRHDPRTAPHLPVAAWRGRRLRVADGGKSHQPSLRDGARCLRRYPQLWILPVVCNLVHAVYGLGVRWLEAASVPNVGPLFRPLESWQPPPWREVLTSSLLPAFEGAAASYNCLITAFPLSAIAALLFLVNWHGYHATVSRALRRRLGIFGGSLVQLGVMTCALGALCKPALFGDCHG